MTEKPWVWTRIDIMSNGTIESLPTQYVDTTTATTERQQLRDGRAGWRVLSDKTFEEALAGARLSSCRLIAVNEEMGKWKAGVVMTFVIYERRANDA